MSLYVHPENQKLLWNTIHTIPMVANLEPTFKNKWFKHKIQMFYEKNPHINDKASLLQINKETIQYMIADIKNLFHSGNSGYNEHRSNVNAVAPDVPSPPHSSPQPTSGDGITTEFTRFETDSKKNTEWYHKAFADRQKEYEIMHAKPLAPDVNFAIKLDDAPLSNMDELIEKYRRERERDMNLLAESPSPPSPPISQPSTMSSMAAPISVSPVTTSGFEKKTTKRPPRLSVIQEESINDEIEPIVVEYVNKHEEMEKQINEMKEEIKQLRNELHQLRNEIKQDIQGKEKDTTTEMEASI